jgi:hypothetical protein
VPCPVRTSRLNYGQGRAPYLSGKFGIMNVYFSSFCLHGKHTQFTLPRERICYDPYTHIQDVLSDHKKKPLEVGSLSIFIFAPIHFQNWVGTVEDVALIEC